MKYYILDAVYMDGWDDKMIRPFNYMLKNRKSYKNLKEARKGALTKKVPWSQHIYAIGEKESDWKYEGEITNKITGTISNSKSTMVWKVGKKTYRVYKDGSIKPW